MRAAAELKKLGDTWGREAEAAFSVEQPLQEHGIGTELMGRVIRAARNRGIQHLCVSCLAENEQDAGDRPSLRGRPALRVRRGGRRDRPRRAPNYFSLLAEAVEDRFGYMMAVLDLHNRVVKAA